MNSVTGESGPVNTDRPKTAVSHEVPDRFERPGPVTPPVGLEGAFFSLKKKRKMRRFILRCWKFYPLSGPARAPAGLF